MKCKSERMFVYRLPASAGRFLPDLLLRQKKSAFPAGMKTGAPAAGTE